MARLMRRPGWEVALEAAVEAARNRPFSWGDHDCATWAADVRRALTGDDAAAAWRGRYRTARGASVVMASLGWATLVDAATAILGAPLNSVGLAGRGDIVTDGESGALGVCLGRMSAYATTDGLTFRPTLDAAMAWRV